MREIKQNRERMRRNERKYKTEVKTKTGRERLRKEYKKAGTR
jgi:hypothetical protein